MREPTSWPSSSRHKRAPINRRCRSATTGTATRPAPCISRSTRSAGKGRPALFAAGVEGRALTPQAASAALAFSAIAWNAAGSWMARSDSTFRSTVMPDFDRPLIKTL